MTAKIAVIKATLKYSTQEELIQGMAPLISPGGLFIHTKATRPTGSEVHFEFQLADGSITYSGEGIVRQEVPFVAGDSSKKSGMLISLKRINRPFKTVVDAILSSQKAEKFAPVMPAKQIVESRVDKSNGFGLLDDVDLDSDLDSLFADITKTPAAPKPPTEDSGMFDQTTIVSGLFELPSNDELYVDYDDSIEGESFDNHANSGKAADDAPTPFPSMQSSIHGIFEPENPAELKKRTTAKTGEFQEEANEVLEAEREKNRLSTLSQLPNAFDKRVSPAITQTHMTAITGQYSATEDLAKQERERASKRQTLPQSLYRQAPGMADRSPTLQGYAFREISQTSLKRNDPRASAETLQGYSLNANELAQLRSVMGKGGADLLSSKQQASTEEFPAQDEAQLSGDYHLDEALPESGLEEIPSSDLPGISIENDLFDGDETENTSVSDPVPEFEPEPEFEPDPEPEMRSRSNIFKQEQESSLNYEDTVIPGITISKTNLYDEMDEPENSDEQLEDAQNPQDSPAEKEDPSLERSHTFDALFPSEDESPSGLFAALGSDILGDDELDNAMTTEFLKPEPDK